MVRFNVFALAPWVLIFAFIDRGQVQASCLMGTERYARYVLSMSWESQLAISIVCWECNAIVLGMCTAAPPSAEVIC